MRSLVQKFAVAVISTSLLGASAVGAAAKDLKKTIDDAVTQGQLALAVLAGGQKELAPVLELLKSIKTTSTE